MFILQFLLCSINRLYLLFNVAERQLLINDRLDESEPYCLSSLQLIAIHTFLINLITDYYRCSIKKNKKKKFNPAMKFNMEI